MAELRQRKPEKIDEIVPEPKPTGDTPDKTALQIAQERYTKFFTRTKWGAIMILIFAAIIYTGHATLSVAVVLMQIIIFREMINLRYIEAKEKKLKGFRTLHWWFLFTTDFYLYGQPILHSWVKLIPFKYLEMMQRSHLMISFSFYVIGFLMFVLTLKKNYYKYQFGQLTWTLMTLLVVVGQSHVAIQNINKGLIWILLPASLIICNDITAYLWGMTFGKKLISRPLTKLSPNKSWEGFVGALFTTIIFAFFFSRFLAQFRWFTCPQQPVESVWDPFTRLFEPASTCAVDPTFVPADFDIPFVGTVQLIPLQLHAVVFALFASLIAPFGGFFASGMKRAYGVKDFDNLFPGHGGMTDRMDCQMLMALFVYVYMATFIRPGILDTPQILYYINQLPPIQQKEIFRYLQNSLKNHIS
jgi:phosphatidate cytidylyltransferase